MNGCARLVAAAALAFGSVGYTDSVVIGIPTLETVRVFREGDAMSQVVGQIDDEGALELVETRNRWHEVRVNSTTTGFVQRTRTRVVEGLGARAADEFRVHFLNVGAGSCAIVECPGTDAPVIVADCGSIGTTPNSLTRPQAVARVRSLIDNRHTHVVLSHADRDHYRYIAEALENADVGHIWLGGDRNNYSSDGLLGWIEDRLDGEEDERLHHAFDDGHFSAEPIGEHLDCGDADTYVLTVNAEDSKNGRSLVLEIRYEDFGVTFTGDAIGDTEASAIENFHNNVATTVLSGSHHGAESHESNSDVWARATAPKVVVFSAGQRFGHPRCDVVQRFEPLVHRVPLHETHCGEGNTHNPAEMTTAGVYTTEHSGTIVVTSSGESPASLFCDGAPRCQTAIVH